MKLIKRLEEIKASIEFSKGCNCDGCLKYKAEKQGILSAFEEEIDNLNKILERLKGYGCGYHKQLEKQILNRIKILKQ